MLEVLDQVARPLISIACFLSICQTFMTLEINLSSRGRRN